MSLRGERRYTIEPHDRRRGTPAAASRSERKSDVSKVFFSMTLSLDGFVAPAGMDMEHAEDPGYKDWLSRWMALQKWVFPQRFFRESLKLGEGGETGLDNRIVEETFNRTGVSIMGKRMFDGGERFWPEEAPFRTPVFVITKQPREPWQRPGGTTFYFVNDGIHSALTQARAAAGGRDVRIAGGANVVLQYLNAGLVDEFSISLAPVFLGEGLRLFDKVDTHRLSVDIVEAVHSPLVTHLRYAVKAG
jgi:dihydrofolate reductase